MPDESKKKQHKRKNNPKEQRKARQRNSAGPVERKFDDKKDNDFKEPGPEFHKNLKRETDDILKITEEENSKYKKKEIKSNWFKYEMPIESYDEIQEQENMGADYEILIEAPLAIGGHFQFKHEKSWDVDLGPSPYDKYFASNMDNLFLSISTIPFHERNNIPKDIFTKADILNMNNRATRAKQKYYNDKSFAVITTTPESDINIVQDDIDISEKLVSINCPIEASKSNLEIENKEVRLEDVRSKQTDFNLTEGIGELLLKDQPIASESKATPKNIDLCDDLDSIDILLDKEKRTVENQHKDVKNINIEEISKEPGPEFHKNLKRETDDILKITEEENSKYKKKEIKSNWFKYEMPIESYDEIQEQENMGADYEILIAAPLAIGGHFQFKHEKSWDVDLGPSPYDKYFASNMDNLFLSISTIPFHERNNIPKDIFTEADILNMNNRATRAKQKYCNDKSFAVITTTPESDINIVQDDIDISEKLVSINCPIEASKSNLEIENKEVRLGDVRSKQTDFNLTEGIGELLLKDQPIASESEAKPKNIDLCDDLDSIDILLDKEKRTVENQHKDVKNINIEEISKEPASTQNKIDTPSNPIIKYPEDLEKWLNDILDD